MIAALLGEPFYLRMDDIAELTDRQLQELYFHPRTKEGQIDFGASQTKLPVSGPPESDEALVRMMAASMGIDHTKVQAVLEQKRERDRQRSVAAAAASPGTVGSRRDSTPDAVS